MLFLGSEKEERRRRKARLLFTGKRKALDQVAKEGGGLVVCWV